MNAQPEATNTNHWRIGLAAVVVSSWAVLAVFSPLLPLNPNLVSLPDILELPSTDAWFGRDDLGRPVFDRLVAGAQTSFLVSVSVVAVSLLAGTLIGAFSGWYGGLVDHVMVRIIDVFLAFPGILLAIALAGVLGPGIENVILALASVGWVGFARLARAQTLSVKSREHVAAAIVLGSGSLRIVFWHIIPLVMAPLIVEATFAVAGVIIAEAGLSFLGLGVQPPDASWGTMIRDGTRYMLMAPHMVLAPGCALLLVVLAVNMAGDWLRDALDVRR